MFRRFFESLILKPPVEDDLDEFARFQIPENHLVRRSGIFFPTYPRSKLLYREHGKVLVRPLHGHPDLPYYLWDKAGENIPRECCWIIQGTAAFANPATNIIFALADGTHAARIRISVEHSSAFPAYIDTSLSDPDGFVWVESRLNTEEDKALLQVAYEDSQR